MAESASLVLDGVVREGDLSDGLTDSFTGWGRGAAHG